MIDFIRWLIKKRQKSKKEVIRIPPISEGKFCANCKHVRFSDGGIGYWACESPKNIEYIPNKVYQISGNEQDFAVHISHYCENLRMKDTYCGREICGTKAVWWDPV